MGTRKIESPEAIPQGEIRGSELSQPAVVPNGGAVIPFRNCLKPATLSKTRSSRRESGSQKISHPEERRRILSVENGQDRIAIGDPAGQGSQSEPRSRISNYFSPQSVMKSPISLPRRMAPSSLNPTQLATQQSNLQPHLPQPAPKALSINKATNPSPWHPPCKPSGNTLRLCFTPFLTKPVSHKRRAPTKPN